MTDDYYEGLRALKRHCRLNCGCVVLSVGIALLHRLAYYARDSEGSGYIPVRLSSCGRLKVRQERLQMEGYEMDSHGEYFVFRAPEVIDQLLHTHEIEQICNVPADGAPFYELSNLMKGQTGGLQEAHGWL